MSVPVVRAAIVATSWNSLPEAQPRPSAGPGLPPTYAAKAFVYSLIAGLTAPWNGNTVLATMRLFRPSTAAVSCVVVMDNWV